MEFNHGPHNYDESIIGLMCNLRRITDAETFNQTIVTIDKLLAENKGYFDIIEGINCLTDPGLIAKYRKFDSQ